MSQPRYSVGSIWPLPSELARDPVLPMRLALAHLRQEADVENIAVGDVLSVIGWRLPQGKAWCVSTHVVREARQALQCAMMVAGRRVKYRLITTSDIADVIEEWIARITSGRRRYQWDAPGGAWYRIVRVGGGWAIWQKRAYVPPDPKPQRAEYSSYADARRTVEAICATKLPLAEAFLVEVGGSNSRRKSCRP